ncbi:MAG: hypothetical protein HKN34_04160 [Gammaproteobacteria bacterium]|nr:hypothetical protein [Gammaproteobacteria bacterium]
MKHQKHLSELSGSISQRNAWMLAFFISLLINGALATGLLLKKQSVTTTFIPPVINQPFKLTDGRYSNAYVEQVSTWFISQTLNYSPASYEYQIDTFSKHVSPELYGKLRQTLLEEFEAIKKQNRSSSFFVRKVRVKGMEAIVSGVRKILIGNTNASTKEEHWRIRLDQRHDGLVTLAGIDIVSAGDANLFLSGNKS